MNTALYEVLVRFIKSREKARIGRDMAEPHPWTTDSIVNTYRFCNINREDDTVTKWIAEFIRSHATADEHHGWFNLVVGRLLNNPNSLRAVGYYEHWCADHFQFILNELKDAGENVFNAAYIVSTNGWKMDKVKYISEMVLDPIWDGRQAAPLEYVGPSHCLKWFEFLTSFNGMGEFMANQIVTDMKYTPYLEDAEDWTTFVRCGPGTRRGLNRLLGMATNKRLKQKMLDTELSLLREKLRRSFSGTYMANVFDDMNNLTNSLCEFDKYCRVYFDEEGKRPKQKYRPRGK